MARIDIYKSGAWHEFIEHKDHWLGTDPMLVIVPEPEDKLQFAKALPALRPGALFTIPELIDRYLKSLGGKGLISIHGLESIFGSIIGENLASYLKIEKYKQGYVKALTDFIYNFRDTATVDLQTAIVNFKDGQLTLKEKDLIRLYAEYEKRLPGYGFDLQSGLVELVQNTSAENLYHHLGVKDRARLIFFGFNHLNPLEEEFIHTVFKNAAGAVFLCREDAAAPEPAVRVQKSIAALLERVKDYAVEHQLPSLQQNDFFIVLSRAIFDSNQQIPAPDPQGKLFITKENSRFSEIISIARRIKHLAEEGVSLHEIRIVAPEYHLYSSIVREVFPEYGIPFFLEDGVPLLRFPLAAVILNLVTQSLQPNPYLIREKIFSSPYISFSTEIKRQDLVDYQESAGAEFIPAAKFDLFLTPEAKYRLDYDYIRNVREKAYRAVKPAREIRQLEVIGKYLDGLDWKNEAEKQAQFFRCLTQFYLLGQAEKGLSLGSARMSGGEFKEALRGLWRRFHIEENIRFAGDQDRDSVAPLVQERDLAILGRIEELLAELGSLFAPMGISATEKFALLELVRFFSRLMSEAHLPMAENPPTATGAGVTVQPVKRGQYRRWDYSFICGLVDGEFPGAEEFNFLQPKKEGLSLGQAYTSVDYARNHFHTLVRSTAKALFLSLPLSHNGRRLPPSPFIKEMERCLPAKIAGTEEPIANHDRLYSKREKLFAIGKNVDQNYRAVLPLLKEVKDRDEALFRSITEILRYDGLAANPASLSEFDGVFGAEALSPDSLTEEIDKITFTPAVFERYAACPLRFFFDDLMHLKTEADYHPDTTEAGILIRSILKEYTAEVCATGGAYDEAAVSIEASVARHFTKEYRGAEDAFQARLQKGLVAGLNRPEAGRLGLFAAFLAYERSAPDLIRPYAGNLFGSVKFGAELEIQVEIDRVDRTLAADYALLFSYTTASTGDPGKVLRGLRFDLPLAILLWSNYAAETDLKIPAAGAGMYLVKSPKAIKRGGYFASEGIRASRQNSVSAARPIFSGQREGLIADDGFAQALEKIEAQLLRLYRLIKLGVFHPPLCDEMDQTCSNCSFWRICRKDQLRLDRLRANLRHDDNINCIKGICDAN